MTLWIIHNLWSIWCRYGEFRPVAKGLLASFRTALTVRTRTSSSCLIMHYYVWTLCIMYVVVYMRVFFNSFPELIHSFSHSQITILIPISIYSETFEEGLCDAVTVWRCYDPKPVKNTPLCIQEDVQGINYYFIFLLSH